jgi:ABC-type antimicrobial peptide transport system permease subunit
VFQLRDLDPIVPPLDILTFVTSALVIVAIGLGTASVPVLRAARIHPVNALRLEVVNTVVSPPV